jgi:plastocyanin
MRPVRPILAIAVLLFTLAACSSGNPNWTYAPPPSVTPVPSSAASGAPGSGAPSAAPSAAPSTAASAAPSGAPSAAPSGGAGEVVQVSAVNIQFDQTSLSVPADAPFGIEFANNDAGIPHNVAIRDGSGADVFVGEVFNGVETRTYAVPPIPAGTYQFICTVHPNMVFEGTAE